MIENNPPCLADVTAASQRLAKVAIRTPLLFSPALSERFGGRVFLKAENLQHTGSFKFRGAYNALSQIPAERRPLGVLACSSGNHASGVAEAGRKLGIAVSILMPSDAPAVKIARTRASGAEVVFYNRKTEDREKLTESLLQETGASLIHPFENPLVIAGQGTVGLEIVEDLKAERCKLDRLFVCTGGGGLAAGVSLVCKEAFPNGEIFAVEPEGFDDYGRSLLAGRLLSNRQMAGSLCDALLTPSGGRLGFAINKPRLAGALTVSDRQALAGVRFAYERHRLIVEPGGAVALAAQLFDKLQKGKNGARAEGETVVIILSGGNIDFPVLQEALKTDLPF